MPELPLQMPELPFRMPELPFRMPGLPLQMPELPFQMPELLYKCPELPFQMAELGFQFKRPNSVSKLNMEKNYFFSQTNVICIAASHLKTHCTLHEDRWMMEHFVRTRAGHASMDHVSYFKMNQKVLQPRSRLLQPRSRPLQPPHLKQHSLSL